MVSPDGHCKVKSPIAKSAYLREIRSDRVAGVRFEERRGKAAGSAPEHRMHHVIEHGDQILRSLPSLPLHQLVIKIEDRLENNTPDLEVI